LLQCTSALPESLKSIIIRTSGKIFVDNLPKSLNELYFVNPYGTIKIIALNENLKILHICGNCDYIDKPIVHGLVKLIWKVSELQKIFVDLLPNTIKKFVFFRGSMYDNKFKAGVFPNSLETLIFKEGCLYNLPFEQGVLPKSLLRLQFDNFTLFNKPFGPNVLPKSLKILKFGKHANFCSSIDKSNLHNGLVIEGCDYCF
jgi:hypothetical protein